MKVIPGENWWCHTTRMYRFYALKIYTMQSEREIGILSRKSKIRNFVSIQKINPSFDAIT